MIETPLVSQADILTHRGFLLAEDEALRAHVSGLVVPDVRPDKTEDIKVGVWFRYPEGERQIKYPFVTLDLLSVEPRFDLFTSEYVVDPKGIYWPSTYPGPIPPSPDGLEWFIRPFLPMQLVYQVAVHSRSSLHDRYLMSVFATDVVPPRPWWIPCDADMTMRRCDRLSMQSADLVETTESGTKRIFRKVYTISLQAEIPQQPLYEWTGGDPETGDWKKVPSLFYQALRAYIPIVAREQVDQYVQEVMSHDDPINDVPAEVRAEAGEVAPPITHEGHLWHASD